MFCEEVEEIIKAVDGIVDSVVVGVPHERFGQMVVTVVEAEEGRAPSERELIESVRSRLSHYKAPRRVFFVDSLERAANGKIDYSRWTDYATDRSQPRN